MPAKRVLPLALVLSLLACKPAAENEAANHSATPSAPTQPTPPARAPRALKSTAWQCGDMRVATRFDDSTLDTMTLVVSGRKFTLHAAQAEEGARFTDDAGNAFWSRPGNVSLTLSGKPAVTCTKSKNLSGWAESESRGVAYRAEGNEPGWVAEVSRGDAPALKATLDYGERTIAIAHTEKLSGDAIGYRGLNQDGTAVLLTIVNKPCADSMSGEELQASAALSVGNQTYSGCAAYLGD